jgi:hypothetical protein
MYSDLSAELIQHRAELAIQALGRVVRAARRLMRSLAHGPVEERDYQQVDDLLGGIALSTEEYALARRRLANARRYAHLGEMGAAQYEVTMMARGVARLGAPTGGSILDR